MSLTDSSRSLWSFWKLGHFSPGGVPLNHVVDRSYFERAYLVMAGDVSDDVLWQEDIAVNDVQVTEPAFR